MYPVAYPQKKSRPVLLWIGVVCGIVVIVPLLILLLCSVVLDEDESVRAETLATRSWNYTVIDNGTVISEEYSTAGTLYLFATRDTGGWSLFDSGYDFSQCYIGENKFEIVSSSFNLPSFQNFQALFLVAELDNPGTGELYCPNLPDGTIAIGYSD